jgi:chromosome segregation ATPase
MANMIDLSQKLEILHERNARLNDEVNNLRFKNSALKTDVQNWQQRVENRDMVINELNAKIAKLVEENRKLQQRLETVVEINKRLNDKMEQQRYQRVR